MTNRWGIAAAATLLMACLGTVYSWSLFTQPLIATFGWSSTVTTWAFALAIFFLGLGAVFGGRWQDRAGPRRVAVTGVVLWGIGNLLAGLFTPRLGAWWIYVSYGMVGGFGLGLGYITPVAAVTKWFPERRGLGSGMVVMGFGLGAFVYNNAVGLVPSFAAASRQAAALAATRAQAIATHVPLDPAQDLLGPAHVSAVMNVFVASGLVFALLGGLCASFLVNPPAGHGRQVVTGTAAGPDLSPGQAMRTPQFYSLWAMLLANVTAGILFISNAVPIMRELTGASPAAALGVYGLVAVSNGLGRFFWGAVSDRIGRNAAYVLIYASQVAIFLTVERVHSLWLVALLFAVVLLCYGGGFGTMPSFAADYFGTRHMGLIYGRILLAWGVAGVAGPIFVAWMKDRTGSFSGALRYIAFMLAAATLLPLVTRRPIRGT